MHLLISITLVSTMSLVYLYCLVVAALPGNQEQIFFFLKVCNCQAYELHDHYELCVCCVCLSGLLIVDPGGAESSWTHPFAVSVGARPLAASDVLLGHFEERAIDCIATDNCRLPLLCLLLA